MTLVVAVRVVLDVVWHVAVTSVVVASFGESLLPFVEVLMTSVGVATVQDFVPTELQVMSDVSFFTINFGFAMIVTIGVTGFGFVPGAGVGVGCGNGCGIGCGCVWYG